MCTGWMRKPSSCDSFLRTPLMRAISSPPCLRSTSGIEPIADLEPDRVERRDVVPAELRGGLRLRLLLDGACVTGLRVALVEHVRGAAARGRDR